VDEVDARKAFARGVKWTKWTPEGLCGAFEWDSEFASAGASNLEPEIVK
jgi:hypothetical protein